jgi:hypothetical protein
LRFSAVQIVFAQNETQRLDGKEITAPGIAEDVAPAARLFDSFTATTGHRSAGAGVHHDPVAAAQGGRETGIPIAPRDNFRARPDFSAERLQGAAIIGAAASEKHPNAAYLLRQLPKNGAQAVRRRQPKIRRRKLSLIDDAQTFRDAFDQDPRGLGSSTFDTEDSL